MSMETLIYGNQQIKNLQQEQLGFNLSHARLQCRIEECISSIDQLHKTCEVRGVDLTVYRSHREIDDLFVQSVRSIS